MRTPKLLALAAVAVAAASTPAATHAAGYTKYTSATCAYTVDAPVGWKVSKGGQTVTFGGVTSQSTYREVILTCTSAGKRATEQALTASAMRTFKKQGYTLAKPKYAGHAGIFTGHKSVANGSNSFVALLEVTSFPLGNRDYIIALAADSKSWTPALNVYTHMLDSFRTK